MNEYNQISNKKPEKLATEKTAFKNCREDMSDVTFEIGKNSYSAKIFGAIAIFAVTFGAKIIIRRYVGNPDMSFSKGDILFWCGIALMIVLVIYTEIKERKRPPISVSCRTLFYNGEYWTSGEISCVKCTKWFERVEVYSNGKKILSFPWEMDNSELFIAWANKCGIVFEDYRMKFLQ